MCAGSPVAPDRARADDATDATDATAALRAVVAPYLAGLGADDAADVWRRARTFDALLTAVTERAYDCGAWRPGGVDGEPVPYAAARACEDSAYVAVQVAVVELLVELATTRRRLREASAEASVVADVAAVRGALAVARARDVARESAREGAWPRLPRCL